jgi:hypothetical protein
VWFLLGKQNRQEARERIFEILYKLDGYYTEERGNIRGSRTRSLETVSGVIAVVTKGLFSNKLKASEMCRIPANFIDKLP